VSANSTTRATLLADRHLTILQNILPEIGAWPQAPDLLMANFRIAKVTLVQVFLDLTLL
jgi:hypothetical protein